MGNPWTPGPWRVLHGDTIFPMDSETLSIAITGRHRPERKANARLIAEAPAMAEALDAWVEPWNGFDDTQKGRRADPATIARIEMTRAILARIRGDAS